VLLFGTNPLVSHLTVGLMGPDPTRRMKQAKASGVKVICVDPRFTETARFADHFLQPLPGHDAAIAAAIINIILEEGWENQEFCRQYVRDEGIADLKSAVSAFPAESVEQWAGLKSGDIRQAAAMFARDHKRGGAFAATGPSMAPFSNLTQHLVETLNVICGRYRQAGDSVPPCPLSPRNPIRAEVVAPPRSFDRVPPSRIRGVSLLGTERPTATLAEEILTPGEGQIRALIADGGNAANCIPGQNQIVKALKSLDLMVTIDPCMTVTAQLADFVIAPLMMYERCDIPLFYSGVNLYQDSWSQFTRAVLDPPAGSELIENWQFYWEIAKRLNLTIRYANSVDLDMETAPESEDLLRIRLANSPVSLDELATYPSGKIFEMPNGTVAPGRPEANARFDVMPAEIMKRCGELRDHEVAGYGSKNDAFPYLLASRRLRHAFNSTCTNLSGTLRRTPYNPLAMNPGDMSREGLRDGESVRVMSRHGEVETKVQADATLRPGVVTLPHGWGALPGSADGPGCSVNALIDCAVDYEPDNAMPRMSALPVRVASISPVAAE